MHSHWSMLSVSLLVWSVPELMQQNVWADDVTCSTAPKTAWDWACRAKASSHPHGFVNLMEVLKTKIHSLKLNIQNSLRLDGCCYTGPQEVSLHVASFPLLLAVCKELFMSSWKLFPPVTFLSPYSVFKCLTIWFVSFVNVSLTLTLDHVYIHEYKLEYFLHISSWMSMKFWIDWQFLLKTWSWRCSWYLYTLRPHLGFFFHC